MDFRLCKVICGVEKGDIFPHNTLFKDLGSDFDSYSAVDDIIEKLSYQQKIDISDHFKLYNNNDFYDYENRIDTYLIIKSKSSGESNNFTKMILKTINQEAEFDG